MQTYETTIVIDSFLKSADSEKLIKKIQNCITNNGGEIRMIEEWGKKRLAYEINRKKYGNYFHILFDGPNSLPHLLEREYRLEESILRYLTVKPHSKTLLKKEKELKTGKQLDPNLESAHLEDLKNVDLELDDKKEHHPNNEEKIEQDEEKTSGAID